MSDSESISLPPISLAESPSACDAPRNFGQEDVAAVQPSDALRVDGAGEPCPAPLIWQEVRESYLKDSTPWQQVHGPHLLLGRRWGQGPPLYFLNNFAATAELYALTAWLLKDDFCCVVFDTATEDRKAALQSPPSVSGFADDLFCVANHLGHPTFQLYGAGFGAAVALQAALDRPQRIERLMLQHGFVNRRLSLFERWLAAVCLRSGQTLDALPQRRRFQAVNHQSWFPPFDQSRFDFLIDSTGSIPLRDLARRALAINKFNITARLKEVACPVMLLRTEGEGRLAADAQAVLEAGLNQPQTEWMHSAGQHPCLTHPHRVAKIIRSFCPLATA